MTSRHFRFGFFLVLLCAICIVFAACSERRSGGGGGRDDDDAGGDDDSSNCDLCWCSTGDLTVVQGCDEWADPDSCDAWGTLVEAQGMSQNDRFCSGTEVAWIGGGGECVIRLDCRGGDDDDTAMR
jgi:hypothetical protein